MKHSTITVIASSALVLLFAPRIADAQCKKWNTHVSTCETSPSTCNGAPLTFGQWRYHYQYLYVDPAETQKACEYAYRFTTYKNSLIVAVPIDDPANPTLIGCQIDVNGNGMIDSSEATWQTVLSLDDVTREPMCELTPNGPYSGLGTTGSSGGHFSSTQRTVARRANTGQLGALRSDVGPARPPATVAGEEDYLVYSNQYIFGYDEDLFIPYIGGVEKHVNVDHIIPRKDMYGCDCGPNSYSNMLLISWKTNIGMSNNSADPRRQAILARWTTP